MVPTLDTIIPYIQEDSLNEIPLTLLLKLLSNSSIINTASSVEQQTLLTRVTTLLRSNHNITRWKATKLFTICLLHPILLLSSNTGNALAALVKILESKCFIFDFQNPGQKEITTLKSTVDCIGFVLDEIRGKPTLTREVLTPKLPAIITSLIDVTIFIPENTIPILSKLLITNTITFRPFGTRLEKVLKNILNDGENSSKLDNSLRSVLLKSLALVSFILSREKQAELWRDNVHYLILEIKSVISIYEACLELADDDEYNNNFQCLPKLPEDISNLKMIFGSLSIDINESPIEIFKASRRVTILCEYLLSYIELTAPTAVTIPFGHYVKIGELLSGLNTNFTPVKKDIRDPATREMIEQSVLECKMAGIYILRTLVTKFKGELYPHMYNIMSILDAAIPVHTVKSKIKVDEKSVIQNETIINFILETAAEYLELTERFNDMTVLGRLIEAALILKESREPIITNETLSQNNDKLNNSNNSRKRNNKNKSNISLSDILSHRELFINKIPEVTSGVLRKFFNTLLTKCELSPGKLSTVLRFVIIDSISNIDVIQNGSSDEKRKFIELLENALLFPGKSMNSISIIPMVANMIGTNNAVYSLLTNPRFPLLPKRIDFRTSVNSDAEYSEKEDDVDADNEKKKEPDNTESESTDFVNPYLPIPGSETYKRKPTDNDELKKEKKRQHLESTNNKIVLENKDLVFHKNEETVAALQKIENELEEEKTRLEDNIVNNVDDTVKVVEEAVIASEEEDDDEEIGSDFEIPEINVEDDQ